MDLNVLPTATLSSGMTVACYVLYKIIAKGHCRSRCCRREMLSFDISSRSPESSEADLEQRFVENFPEK